ncbi:hypothetical protein PT974_04445 [Cladobotryum mycophilum]|uniref:Uncharacterized protein n=1 Tax=Cladobotryum mycophilum TaxID=491253 RepID=A0ABR0SV86_9HYPO
MRGGQFVFISIVHRSFDTRPSNSFFFGIPNDNQNVWRQKPNVFSGTQLGTPARRGHRDRQHPQRSLEAGLSTYKGDPHTPPPTVTSTQKDWHLTIENEGKTHLTLWAIFLDKIGVGASNGRGKSRSFDIASLDTECLPQAPSAEEIKLRCSDPMVREYMRLDSILCSPVYMITGLKIAKGFKFEEKRDSSRGFDGGIKAEVVPQAGVEARAGISKRVTKAIGFAMEGDVIFAYQLIRITPKGWGKDKRLEVSEYHHHDAFLADGETEGENEYVIKGGSTLKDPVEVDVNDIAPEDIKELKKAQVADCDEGIVIFKARKEA